MKPISVILLQEWFWWKYHLSLRNAHFMCPHRQTHISFKSPWMTTMTHVSPWAIVGHHTSRSSGPSLCILQPWIISGSQCLDHHRVMTNMSHGLCMEPLVAAMPQHALLGRRGLTGKEHVTLHVNRITRGLLDIFIFGFSWRPYWNDHCHYATLLWNRSSGWPILHWK